ncbi:MAG: glycosyltransferase family 2 protein [Candidatus Delongbacteria bacterium]
MEFKYSRHEIKGRPERLERFLEFLPGAVSWTIILSMCVLSVAKPLFASVAMLVFLLYWILRMIYMNIFLVLSYLRLKIEKNSDWMKHIETVDNLIKSGGAFSHNLKGIKGLQSRVSALIHNRQLSMLKNSGDLPPLSRNIYHVVIVPVVHEGFEVVEPGIRALKNGDYPSERFLVIIALEETASDKVKREMNIIKHEYKDEFLDLLIAEHPTGRAGEARVKGANTTNAAKKAEMYLEKSKIPLENVLLSCFDADTVAGLNYFSCLTYYYMVTPNRLHSSYQPIPVYHNNIWDAPGFARIIDVGTSFFQLIEATHPEKLVTFSSHSMSFKALKEVGYWPVDMVSDDSAIFWKSFIHYDGDYHVKPIYTTVSMDIALGPSLKKTFSLIYKQKRRWAWGIENFPIVIRAFLDSKKISLKQKISHGYKLFDSFISWSTWSFLLLLGSWMPAFFATREFESTTLYYTAPRLSGIIFNLASIGLIICMIISLLLLPRTKTKYGFLTKIKHIFEWLFIPVILLFLSAFPALDAQTRLMTGKYLESWDPGKYREEKKTR